LPCDHVDCCDDFLSFLSGVDCAEESSCPRAIVRKK